MRRNVKCVTSILLMLFLSVMSGITVFASDGEYITISVDATDDNGNLLYALDTDDPGAFSSSNEFYVPAGTSHTIYVKDAAGNISSQVFTPSDSYTQQVNEDERTVNIDVTLDDTPDYSDYEYAGDLLKDPAESGQGTVYDKIMTDANDPDSERLFYTVTTDEGEVFYLVIDQSQSSNNVYLLDQVNVSDLKALAVNDSGSAETNGSSSLLSALSGETESEEETLLNNETSSGQKSKNSTLSTMIIVLIIAAVGGGFYYYKNIYKNKKDEQMDLIDAPDKDDFAAEDDDDEDEVDFGLDDDYQEQIMAQLMEEDDIPSEQSETDDKEDDPMPNNNEVASSLFEDNSNEFYAMSHNADTDNQKPEPEEQEDEYDEELDGSDDEEDDE